MSRRRWSPTSGPWFLSGVALAGAFVALVLSPQGLFAAVPAAVALAAAALAVDRQLRRRDRGASGRIRRQRTDELALAGRQISRRPVLAGGVAALLGLVGAVGAGALVRFGPRRRDATGWRDGVRLVGVDGLPLHVEDLADGGIATVWPEGPERRELAAAVVLRLPAGTSSGAGSDTAEVPLVAYSRICTHAGCPVGLFRADEGTLYCPCHQATFDATADARPVFGPASRPLPGLPIAVDGDGYLIARGDFTAPPGPGHGGR